MEAAAARQRKNDPKGTRERILAAAYDLFQNEGYNATSVLNLVKASGVTPGAFHHHFTTKKQLGLAVIDEKVAAAVEAAWLAPVRSAPDGAAAVVAVFNDLADEIDDEGRARGCPVSNLSLELSFADPDFRAALARLFDDWRATIAAALDGPDAAGRALLVVAAYSGAMAIAKTEQRGDALRQCARLLRSTLAPSLMP